MEIYAKGKNVICRGRCEDGHGVVCETGPEVQNIVIGDRIVFGRYCSNQVDIDGEVYSVISEDEIYASYCRED